MLDEEQVVISSEVAWEVGTQVHARTKRWHCAAFVNALTVTETDHRPTWSLVLFPEIEARVLERPSSGDCEAERAPITRCDGRVEFPARLRAEALDEGRAPGAPSAPDTVAGGLSIHECCGHACREHKPAARHLWRDL